MTNMAGDTRDFPADEQPDDETIARVMTKVGRLDSADPVEPTERMPTFANTGVLSHHDPGCNCWPHVSERDAIDAIAKAALDEYREARSQPSAEKPAVLPADAHDALAEAEEEASLAGEMTGTAHTIASGLIHRLEAKGWHLTRADQPAQDVERLRAALRALFDECVIIRKHPGLFPHIDTMNDARRALDEANRG
jgi:hypothetical protein